MNETLMLQGSVADKALPETLKAKVQNALKGAIEAEFRPVGGTHSSIVVVHYSVFF